MSTLLSVPTSSIFEVDSFEILSNLRFCSNRDFVQIEILSVWDFVRSGFCPIRDFVVWDFFNFKIYICGQVDRASATKTIDSGSIPSRVKPKTIKIGI